MFFNGVLISVSGYLVKHPTRSIGSMQIFFICSFLFKSVDFFEFGFYANLFILSYKKYTYIYIYNKYICLYIVYFVGGIMLTNEKAHFWSGGISRSMSEGNLFDMEAQKSSKNCDITGTGIYNY